MYGDYAVKTSGASSDEGVCLFHGVLSLVSDGLCDGGVRNSCLVMCHDGWSANVWLFHVEKSEDQSVSSSRSTRDHGLDRGVSSWGRACRGQSRAAEQDDTSDAAFADAVLIPRPLS